MGGQGRGRREVTEPASAGSNRAFSPVVLGTGGSEVLAPAKGRKKKGRKRGRKKGRPSWLLFYDEKKRGNARCHQRAAEVVPKSRTTLAVDREEEKGKKNPREKRGVREELLLTPLIAKQKTELLMGGWRRGKRVVLTFNCTR